MSASVRTISSDVGTVRHRHLGVVSEDGVDLRAEVAVLSRNIRIHGEMEESCYDDNRCDYFSYDTFGGHIQVGYVHRLYYIHCITHYR